MAQTCWTASVICHFLLISTGRITSTNLKNKLWKRFWKSVCGLMIVAGVFVVLDSGYTFSPPSGKSLSCLEIPLNREFIENGELIDIFFFFFGFFTCTFVTRVLVCMCVCFLVTDKYNESLVFALDDRHLLYSVREPIVNRVFSNSRQRGFANKWV